jgi:hypothetical protein
MTGGELILYQTEDGRTRIQLRAVDGTVWLSQLEMASLFDTTKQNVSLHVSNIFKEDELPSESVVKDSLTTAADGKAYRTKLYNLDMILAVGYRVRSPRGSQFRRWATTTLREYLVKGFVMNDERLKDPGGFDYFDELLERIREIRASEKRFYQKVRDLFAQTSVDYDGTTETARRFFQTIQNKMLFAVTGHTAAELIVDRADAGRPNMGLTSWRGSLVRKADVVIAKTYLNRDEITELNRLVTMFLDFAEDRAARRQQTRMADWVAQTDRFLTFTERPVLADAGRVSHDDMRRIAHERFQAFADTRRAEEARTAEAEHLEELRAIEADALRRIGRKDGGA